MTKYTIMEALKMAHDMLDVEHEFANSIAGGIVDTIDEIIMMTKKGYKLNVETWLDPTLDYG